MVTEQQKQLGLDRNGATIYFGSTVRFFDKHGTEFEGPVTATNASGKVWINHPKGGSVLRMHDSLTVVS